jgi:hypothetical protein
MVAVQFEQHPGVRQPLLQWLWGGHVDGQGLRWLDLAAKFGFTLDYSKPFVDGPKRGAHVRAVLVLCLEALGILPYAVNLA